MAENIITTPDEPDFERRTDSGIAWRERGMSRATLQQRFQNAKRVAEVRGALGLRRECDHAEAVDPEAAIARIRAEHRAGNSSTNTTGAAWQETKRRLDALKAAPGVAGRLNRKLCEARDAWLNKGQDAGLRLLADVRNETNGETWSRIQNVFDLSRACYHERAFEALDKLCLPEVRA